MSKSRPPGEEKIEVQYNHEFGTNTMDAFKDLSLTNLDNRPLYRCMAGPIVTGPSPLDTIFSSVGHAEPPLELSDPSFSEFTFQHVHKKSLELPSLHHSSEGISTGISAPPTAPKWIEPHHNFRTSCNADLVMEKLKDILNDMQVDHVDRDNKFKLICVAYKKGGAISFVVRIFTVKDDDKDKFLVEVQRRAGDVFHFAEIFQLVKTQLQKSGLINCDDVTDYPHSPLSQSSDEYMWDVSDVKQAQSDMKNLLEMCSSKFVDVKAEGLRALCHLSTDANVHAIMVELGALDICFVSLASTVEDIHRCALTIMANLVGSAEVGNTIGDTCLSFLNQGLFSRVGALARSSCKEVMRECARLVANIATVAITQAKQGSSKLKQKLQSEELAEDVVKFLLTASDPRVRQWGSTLSNVLR